MCLHNLMPWSRRLSQRHPYPTRLWWKVVRKGKWRPTLLLRLSFLCPLPLANGCFCHVLRPEMSHSPLMSCSYSVNAGQSERNVLKGGDLMGSSITDVIAVGPMCPTDTLTIKCSILCPLYLSVNLLLLI